LRDGPFGDPDVPVTAPVARDALERWTALGSKPVLDGVSDD
jgi:hypothetical protein